jgi:hypothetical protein
MRTLTEESSKELAMLTVEQSSPATSAPTSAPQPVNKPDYAWNAHEPRHSAQPGYLMLKFWVEITDFDVHETFLSTGVSESPTG